MHSRQNGNPNGVADTASPDAICLVNDAQPSCPGSVVPPPTNDRQQTSQLREESLERSELPELPLAPRDLFWPRPHPLDKDGYVCGWYDPPVGAAVQEQVENLAQWLEHNDHRPQGLSLRLLAACASNAREELHVVVNHSADQLDCRNRRIAQSNTALEDRIRATESAQEKALADLKAAQAKASELCAAAGVLGDTIQAKRQSLTVTPSRATLAGGEGITYLAQALHNFEWLGTWGAPLSAAIVGVFMFTVVGEFELSQLDRIGDTWPRLLLAIMTGMVIVSSIAGLTAYGVRNIMRPIHDREPGTPPKNVKTQITTLVAAATIAAGILVMVAEITVGGFAIHSFNEQHIIELARLQGHTIAENALRPLHLVICGLIATLVTTPFICFKAAHAYDEVQRQDRDNYLSFLEHQHLRKRVADDKVQKAQAALDAVARQEAEIERLSLHLVSLQAQRQPFIEDVDSYTKLRREAARMAAVGGAFLLYDHFRRIVEAIDPLQPGMYRAQRQSRSGVLWQTLALLVIAIGAGLFAWAFPQQRQGPSADYPSVAMWLGVTFCVGGLLLGAMSIGSTKAQGPNFKLRWHVLPKRRV